MNVQATVRGTPAAATTGFVDEVRV